MFSGTYTALVSPFLNDQIDDASYAKLIEHQIAGEITGIVPVGTTGESPTLEHAEHLTLVRRAVEIARGRCQVIAGAGSNSTRKTIAMAKECEQLGVDGLLLVAPYYNKPSPEGLFRHFSSVAAATKLPIMLYNIPGRCGVEIGVEVVRRLAAECPNIVSIKEAGGTPERVSQMRQVLPADFTILSGDDSLTLPFLAVGAVGVVSVASNLIPAEVVALVNHFADGQPLASRVLHHAYYPIFKEIFVEPNPVPIKLALLWKGIIASAEVRAPLGEATRENSDRLRALLVALKVL
jgi:4-hydroxy-tetrahydrodipicolinate synthase